MDARASGCITTRVFIGNQWLLQVDTGIGRLSVAQPNFGAPPPEANCQSLRLSPKGLILVEVLLGEEPLTAVFDTGAELSVIDKNYVASHPKFFDFVQTVEGGSGEPGIKYPNLFYVEARPLPGHTSDELAAANRAW